MSIPRFHIAPTAVHGATILLDDPREVHHAREVLRLKPGDACVLLDGQGTEYHAHLTHVASHRLVLAMDRVVTHSSAGSLTLIQALPKLPAFETILRQATELGVTRIVPVLTQRSVVRLTAADWPRKQTRWLRILREAAKQCQRVDLPELIMPLPWAACLTQHLADEYRVMLTLALPAPALAQCLRAPLPREVTLCIGPEGDFTREEAQAFLDCGGQLASLGSLVLRSDTAALASLAILQHERRRQDNTSLLKAP